MARFSDEVKKAVQDVRTRVPGLERFAAQVDGRTVTLRGTCPDLRTKTRAMVLFSDSVPADNVVNAIRLRRPVTPENPGKRVGFDLGASLEQLLRQAGRIAGAEPTRRAPKLKPRFEQRRVEFDEVPEADLRETFGTRYEGVQQRLAKRQEKQWAQLGRRQQAERAQLEKAQARDWEQLERELDKVRRGQASASQGGRGQGRGQGRGKARKRGWA